MGDLIGKTVEPWDEPTWKQCELCSKYYKPTVIDFHKRICSYNSSPTTIPVEPSPPGQEPEGREPKSNLDIQQQQKPEPQSEPEQLLPDLNTLSSESTGITCSNCRRTFLNSIRYRNHKCADWVK
ncbi:MAG TPA: hypothetical protein VH415_10520 [Nitrososphaeraceae archaeon]|jgi:hypothetical protein